jgi:hypothetical protein
MGSRISLPHQTPCQSARFHPRTNYSEYQKSYNCNSAQSFRRNTSFVNCFSDSELKLGAAKCRNWKPRLQSRVTAIVSDSWMTVDMSGPRRKGQIGPGRGQAGYSFMTWWSGSNDFIRLQPGHDISGPWRKKPIQGRIMPTWFGPMLSSGVGGGPGTGQAGILS